MVPQLILLQVSLTGVMMEESRTLYCPITGEKMLPLKEKSENGFIRYKYKIANRHSNMNRSVSVPKLTLNK